MAEIAKKVVLKLHVSLSVNGAKHPEIGLPYWVVKIGEAEPLWKDTYGASTLLSQITRATLSRYCICFCFELAFPNWFILILVPDFLFI